MPHVLIVVTTCATFLPTVFVPKHKALLWSIRAAAKISLADAIMSSCRVIKGKRSVRRSEGMSVVQEGWVCELMPVCESTSNSKGVCSSGRKLVLRYLSSPSLGNTLATNIAGSFITYTWYRESHM